MRECLGWLISCDNEQSCPQNWLEHAVTEIPLDVDCHVCGRVVALVESGPAAHRVVASGGLVVYPVVPPIALDSSPGASSGLGSPDLEMERFGALSADDDSVRVPTPAPARRAWYCTLANGETIRVDKESMVVGRSRTCDIVIPSAKVSRQHASLTLVGGELWIEDLGSANGVWNDGEKITRTKVSNGASFTISDETLLFEVR